MKIECPKCGCNILEGKIEENFRNGVTGWDLATLRRLVERKKWLEGEYKKALSGLDKLLDKMGVKI